MLKHPFIADRSVVTDCWFLVPFRGLPDVCSIFRAGKVSLSYILSVQPFPVLPVGFTVLYISRWILVTDCDSI